MEKLKVAFLAASMPNFSDEGPVIYRQYQSDLKKAAEELNFDLTVYKEIIMTETRAMEVRKEIDSKDFDFVLLFHPTYIIGDLIYELMKTKAYLGLWAVEESTKDGPLPLASFVCLNQNVSIAGHYFRDNPKKFKWFFGDINHRYFKPRFEITIKALTAVKNLKDAKVAQIGKISDGFRDMYYDERSVYSNLGVDIVRGVEIEDVLAEAEKLDDKLVKQEVERVYSACSKVTVKDAKIIASVKNYLAVKKICEDNGFKAVGFSCWPKLNMMNLTGCLTVSLLDSAGIPAGCEGDTISAVSMLILRYLSNLPTAVMDLHAFDDEDESVLMGHCGAAPFEMANKCGVACRIHYRAEFSDQAELDGLAPTTDLVFPETEMTVFRLTRESDRFFYFTGRGFDEKKKSYDGSRGWITDLRLYGRQISAIDLVNTVLDNHLQHHFPLILQDVSSYIEEFASWLGLKKIEKREYKDYLY